MKFVLRTAIAASVLVPGIICQASEVGRQLSFQDRGSANYTSSELTSDELDDQSSFELPDLPSPASRVQKGVSSREFLVTKVQVEGVTAFSQEQIAELVAPFEGKSLSIEDVSTLRLQLSELYLRAGFVNSGVIVPDQNVDEGILRLSAVEGGLSGIKVADGSGLRERYLRRRINRRVQRPLNIADLRVALEHLQRDAMVSRVDARLVPGDQPGEGLLDLDVQSAKKVAIELVGDNHRSASVGEERARLSLSLNNLTGLGESLHLSHTEAEGGDGNSVNLILPLFGARAYWKNYYAQADAEVIDEAFAVLDITSDVETMGTQLGYSIVDTLRHQLVASIGFESKEANSELAGEPFSFSPGAEAGETDTRSALAGLDWSVRRPSRVMAIRGTYRRGLNVGGATIFDPEPDDILAQLGNPTGADGRFETWLVQGLLIQRLNTLIGLESLSDRAQLVVRTTLQRSSDPLMSLEKIAIGGVNTVRGVRENLLVRDNGTALNIELQLPFWGYRPQPGWRNLIFAPFLDFGKSWDEVDVDQSSTLRDTTERRKVTTLGLGVLWNPLPGLKLESFWGERVDDNFAPGQFPTNNRGSNLQDDGFHVAATYRLTF